MIGSVVAVVQSLRLPTTPRPADPGVALSTMFRADLGFGVTLGVVSVGRMSVLSCLRLFDMFLCSACIGWWLWDCCCGSAGAGFVVVIGSVAAAVW